MRAPDFEALRATLTREGDQGREAMLELFADPEIIAAVLEEEIATPVAEADRLRFAEMRVEFWTRLGYDTVRVAAGPALRYDRVATGDTADLQRSQREWYAAELGIVNTWEAFKAYDWPETVEEDFAEIELTAEIIPKGMEILGGVTSALEPVMWLMGYAPFALALHEDPDLVAAIFDRCAGIYLPVAERILDMDSVGGLFIGDDMGFKTATMISPDHLREYVFPYHQRLAEMAHERGKVYLLHACGNLEAVMDDLIDDVRIDAKHSFEDIIMPIEEVVDLYGERTAIIGGIDMDLLCRAPEAQVRERVREVLDACMGSGSYVLGTRNSVANYVPLENFLAMVDEGHRWEAAQSV